MVAMPYLTCGLFYCFFAFQRIYRNWDSFLMTMEEEFGTTEAANGFLGILFLTSLLFWPLLLLNDLKNKRDIM